LRILSTGLQIRISRSRIAVSPILSLKRVHAAGARHCSFGASAEDL
jgi:hypothetical protein